MARIVLTDVSVVINNVNLSDHVASVTIQQNHDAIETTAFGDSGRKRTGGLEDSSISLDFHNDNASASVDQTIQPLLGGTASISIQPSGTATPTAANPRYTATVLLTEWSPLSGAVGDLSVASVTWPVSGTISYGTA
jgi:hypothetical protein